MAPSADESGELRDDTIAGAASGGASPGLEPVDLDAGEAPEPDPAAEPAGFIVLADGDVRLHFHDWSGPRDPTSPRIGVLLLPGILQPAWSWSPVARRLAGGTPTVVADLRGQGLSDAPLDGYDRGTLAADALAVAEGSGLLRPPDAGGGEAESRLVVAGHGLGGIVAAEVAARLGGRCARLVLADGGWERFEATTGVDVDEFLRGLEEPPEVMRSMAAWLADRRGFDPASWDADQERVARDAVVETAAGHVVRSVRPHVVEALVRTMFDYDPEPVLAGVEAPVTALVALGAGEAGPRLAELRRSAVARAAAGRPPIAVQGFAGVAHNLMRYRPAEVTAAILGASRRDGVLEPAMRR
jgi:pimeloyl-ACP methyl ester carboxylesterase